MLWKNRVQPCIDGLRRIWAKRVAGNGSIYIWAMLVILFLLLIYKTAINKERMYVTYDAVDDAIVSSLVSASAVNITEYGRSGQLIIYDDVTDLGTLSGDSALTEEQKAQNFLTDADLFSPTTDYYLNSSYSAFLNSLKVNLKLDNAMNATISGIDGVVDIEKFSIYNRFEYYDSVTGALLHYRFIRYSFNGSTWSVEPYNIDTPVTVFNSFDDAYTTLDSTTIVANLNFMFKVVEDDTWFGVSALTKEVNYQRLVDVTD